MAASCTYHLPSPGCSTGAIPKNIHNFSGKRSGEWPMSRKMTIQKEQMCYAEKDASCTPVLDVLYHPVSGFISSKLT